MKKLITALFGFALVCFSADAVERKIGFTASVTDVESTGTETLKTSSKKSSTSVDESVVGPSIFFEVTNDAGLGIGIDFVPGDAELGNKSKAKVASQQDVALQSAG